MLVHVNRLDVNKLVEHEQPDEQLAQHDLPDCNNYLLGKLFVVVMIADRQRDVVLDAGLVVGSRLREEVVLGHKSDSLDEHDNYKVVELSLFLCILELMERRSRMMVLQLRKLMDCSHEH